jgi:hypothetical protein
MSTPSGKPFDPFDLSPYAPKRARERSTLDRPPEESNNSESEADPALAFAPRAAMKAEKPEDAHPQDIDPRDSDAADTMSAAPMRAAAAEPVAEKAAAEAAAHDPDLQRLEASLNWIQREGAASRLPRAVQLPPVSGLRPPRGEQFINGVRVPPSLAPERLRPPPIRERRDNLRGPLRVVLASVIAAPIAYYFSVGSFTHSADGTSQSGLASLASRLVASTEFPIPKDKLRPSEVEAYNTAVSSRNKLVALPSPSPAKPELAAASTAPADTSPAPVVNAAPAAPQPVLAAAPAAPSDKVRDLDADSIKHLIQQGEQFVASGDLATARQVFRRAAEAGDAAAALALGATYDPGVLAKIGVQGVGADIAKARGWYEKAREFGSAEAPRRIEMLANR